MNIRTSVLASGLLLVPGFGGGVLVAGLQLASCPFTWVHPLSDVPLAALAPITPSQAAGLSPTPPTASDPRFFPSSWLWGHVPSLHPRWCGGAGGKRKSSLHRGATDGARHTHTRWRGFISIRRRPPSRHSHLTLPKASFSHSLAAVSVVRLFHIPPDAFQRRSETFPDKIQPRWTGKVRPEEPRRACWSL